MARKQESIFVPKKLYWQNHIESESHNGKELPANRSQYQTLTVIVRSDNAEFKPVLATRH